MIWNKRHLSVFITSALFLLLASGCLKNDLAEREANEKKVIQQYLTANNISGDTKTEGGIYYIEEVAGTGLSPVLDDYIVIDYVGRFLESGVIRETSYDSLKNDWPAADNYVNFLFGPTKIVYGHSISGINEGLSLMKEGGKAKIIIPSDKAYYDFNPMIYEIRLIKVIKDPVAYADSMLHIYLDANGFDESTKKNDSIWFRETEITDTNETRVVQAGDEVYFSFSGLLIDEFRSASQDTFDTNSDDDNPIILTYGNSKVTSGSILAPAAGLPTGLILALDSMRFGAHATAVLPYRQAFGAKGLINSVYGYTIVPTYQPVVYNIVIEDIIKPAKK
jgi:hypothetical protein